MELSKGLKTPTELLEAIEIAKLNDEQYSDAIHAITKHKWYNWYQNYYIKANSPEDIENTRIFNELEETHSQIHADIEKGVDSEIKKLEIED